MSVPAYGYITQRAQILTAQVRILQEPSPLMLAATHMSMGKHFDMDELFQHLVSTIGNKGKTKAGPQLPS